MEGINNCSKQIISENENIKKELFIAIHFKNQEFNRTLKEISERIPKLNRPFEKRIT